MALNCDLFSKREGASQYIVVDNSSAEYSEPLWLTGEQVKIFDHFTEDSSWQLVGVKDRLIPRRCIIEFWQDALDFSRETETE